MAKSLQQAVHGLWADHPATPSQQFKLFDRPRRHGRVTQSDLILSLLRSCRANGTAVPLPEIMRLGVGQYNARILTLRRKGFVIENEMQRIDGVVHSSYRLTYDPERDGVQP